MFHASVELSQQSRKRPKRERPNDSVAAEEMAGRARHGTPVLEDWTGATWCNE